MADQTTEGATRPGWEVFDDPIHGRVVRDNFAVNHPPEDETKYAGLFVAYSLDGHTALAAANTISELGRIVEGLGVPGDQWIPDYYDPPDGRLRIGLLEGWPVNGDGGNPKK